MRLSLSAKTIAKLAYDPGNPSNTYFDMAIRGFAVRVYPSGAKSYLLKFRVGKKQHMKVIGDATLLPFEKARKRALEMLQEAAEAAANPKLYTRMTMNQFADMYMQRHATPKKDSAKNDLSRLTLYILPALGPTYLDEITEEKCGDLLTFIGIEKDFPIQANRTKEQLCKMFDLAVGWGKLPKGFENPARSYDAFEEHIREEFLTPEQVERVLKELTKESKLLEIYFCFLIMTGIRKCEALRLRWEDVNWQSNTYYSIKSKNGKPAWYPLTSGLKVLLQELERIPGHPFLFPGRKPGQKLVNVDKAWRRVRKRAKVEHITVHDLRHTCGALLVEAGHNLPVIGKCLNHDSLESTRRYAHVPDKRVMTAFDGLHSNFLNVRAEVSDSLAQPTPDTTDSTNYRFLES